MVEGGEVVATLASVHAFGASLERIVCLRSVTLCSVPVLDTEQQSDVAGVMKGRFKFMSERSQ